MEINELRIGCFVSLNAPYNDSRNGIIEVKKIADYLNAESFVNDFPFKYIEPIPLTEEILAKCGFNKGYNTATDTYQTLEMDNDLELEYYNGELELKSYSTGGLTRDTKYLHQLQNLYYALCGKELEIKLD